MSRDKNEQSAALVERITAGGPDAEDAADALYQLWATPIYSYLRHQLKNQEDADDLFQLTWSDALNTLPRFDEDRGTFQNWLYGIARHRVYSLRRKKKPTVALDDHGDDRPAMELADEGPGPDEQLSRSQSLQALSQCMGCLDERSREVFVLFKLQGLSHNQIAELMEISSANSRKIYQRTRLQLVDCLRGKGVHSA
jgi:RNA polymerase sigma factor (sigma-70 family)